ncbi:MAG: prolyl oligopeptidase family serine peptidase [Opitutales bacterium]|nr:prolyl oligopeptidase family serine peptidase [Opitutales bacterium]
MSLRSPFLSLLFLMAASFSTSGLQADLFPLPYPSDLDPYWGDPDQDPEQRDRFRNSHQMTPFTISWPINEGNLFTDWGHFRLSRNMINGRPFQALKIDLDGERESPRALRDAFENKPWKDGNRLRISVLSPPADQTPPRGGWPVVFTFPGAGGVGRDEIRPDRMGGTLLWASGYYRENMPAYVIAFHPASRPFSYRDGGEMGISTSATWEAYLEVVDAFAEREDVNPNRLYAIGHSMGGTSTWYLMRDRPGLLAAAVPNAGQPPADEEDYVKLLDTPILMIQGHNDHWVGSSSYIWAYEQLMAVNHPRVRFWEIQDIGHSGGSMELTIIHQWMYQQERGSEAPPQPPFRESAARSWQDRDGRAIEAVFHTYENGQVHLILPDDTPVQVPLARFSETDRDHLFELTRVRIWRNKEGVEVEAKLLEVKADSVEIERADGQTFSLLREHLSEQDQAFLEGME